MASDVKTIKGVGEDSWNSLKSLAARNGRTMGEMLGQVILDYTDRSEDFWKKVLDGERLLSDREADELLEFTKKLRKERGFRI